MQSSMMLITRWRSDIERELQGLAMRSALQSRVLSDALEYVLLGGGKRLRALLALAVEDDLSKDASLRRKALSSAVAIEALHAASLVHDDLPALDNDDMRRGRSSCHRRFGEATAILAGDALIGAAFHHVASDEALCTDTRARLSKVLSKVWRDLCVGQQLDLSQTDASTAEERALMVQLKTGVLFGSAVACGAICGGVSDAAIERYCNWGVRVGECFQALDDLDDGERPESDRPNLATKCREVVDDAQQILQLDERGMTALVVRVICQV